MKRLLIAFAALLWIQGSFGQNPILNNSFEIPGLPEREQSRFLTNGSTFIAGWTVVDDGVGEPPIYVKGPYSEAIVTGEYGLILNQGSGVKTVFHADAGAFYEFAVWLRPGTCKVCVSPAPLEVTISGNVYHLPLVEGWSRQTIQFWATNALNSLEIRNPSSPADFKQFGIDEVSVTKLNGATLGVRFYPGVIVNGFLGQHYEIQAANDLNSPSWVTLTNIFLTNSPYIFIDLDPKRPTEYPPGNRIYRAIQVQ